MFGWRRRSEGFEWREYVRTNVLVRRADRQRRIDDARMEVLAKVKDTRDRGIEAGRAGVEAASSQVVAIGAAAGSAAWSGLKRTAETTWDILCAITAAGVAALPAKPVIDVAAIKRSLPARRATVSDTAQKHRRPSDQRPAPDVAWKFSLPFKFNPRLIGGSALALALVVVGGPMLQSSNDVTAARFIPTVASTNVDKTAVERPQARTTVELIGRATAISGDLMRINGELVRLAGIETPGTNYPCVKANGRRWNCAASARTALEKIVRGKTISCNAKGTGDDGRTLAECDANGEDIASALVRGGHVFAAKGLFSSYSSVESEARSEKAGLWQSDPVRPDEWRTQVWEEAKRAAPEGCPIKGFTRASDRLYAMPWSQNYDGAKVRATKGDRWFCSEEEARAAGFKSAS
jgi:endonuclease YncB( thermonuclease family)